MPAAPADGDAACDILNDVSDGDVVVVNDGVMRGFDNLGDTKLVGCDVRANLAKAKDVTVRGSWKGDVRCRDCNGWVFENLTVTSGSLRMIGGTGWTIRDSSFDGGGRGMSSVLGTGSADPGSQVAPHPTDWLIDNVVSGNAGCRPEGFPHPTHVRALYIIGWNGSDMGGTVRNSEFNGWDCGYTVKIGGTGNTGVCPGDDAADAVTFTGNTIRNQPAPEGTHHAGAQPDAMLVSTNSDDVTIVDNDIEAPRFGIVASGPFTGDDLLIQSNTVSSSERWLLWRRLSLPCGSPVNWEEFEDFTSDGCDGLGECTENTLQPYGG